MSDDLSKVDWARPLVAYHQDGRAMPVELYAGETQPDGEGDYEIIPPREVPTAYFREDGTPSPNGGARHCGWHIRNVAEAPRNSKAPSDDIAKRMEALEAILQSLAFFYAGAKRRSVTSFTVNGQLVRDIEDAIVALLPEPVDADEQYARDLIRDHGWSDMGNIGIEAVTIMIAKAHREGRALERDSREG